MSETKTNAKPAPVTGGKFTKPAEKHAVQDDKRAQATHHLIVRLIVGLAVAAGIYTAQATGDMSARLALLLAGAVLAGTAYWVGTWKQFMWPKEV